MSASLFATGRIHRWVLSVPVLGLSTGALLAQSGQQTLTGPVEVALELLPGRDASAVLLDEPGGVVFTVHRELGMREVVSAFDVETGAMLWETDSTPWSVFVVSVEIPELVLSPDGSRLFVSFGWGQFDSLFQEFQYPTETYAIDTATGELAWEKFTFQSLAELAASSDGSRVHQTWSGTAFGRLVTYDAADGEEVEALNFQQLDESRALTVSAFSNRVYAAGADQVQDIFGQVLETYPTVAAVDSGVAEVWTERLSPDSDELRNGIVKALALSEDESTLFAGGDLFEYEFTPFGPRTPIDLRPFVTALDPVTGAEVWGTLLPVDDDHELVALAAPSCSPRVYAVTSGAFDPLTDPARYELWTLEGSSGAVLGVAPWTVLDGSQPLDVALVDFELSEDGRTFTSAFRAVEGESELIAQARSVATGEVLFETRFAVPGAGFQAADANLSADGRTLAVAGSQGVFPATPQDGHVLVYRAADPGLRADLNSISAATGGVQSLTLDAGACFAASTYLIAGTLSGTSPGQTSSGGLFVPLNPDSYFTSTIAQPGSGPLVGAVGVLDLLGVASAQFVVPAGLPPVFASLEVDHAYGLLDPLTGTLQLVSAPVALDMEP